MGLPLGSQVYIVLYRENMKIILSETTRFRALTFGMKHHPQLPCMTGNGARGRRFPHCDTFNSDEMYNCQQLKHIKLLIIGSTVAQW